VTTALYRRYRPDTFAEVIGQEHVTEPLSAALRADRINHAYLFSGPRGCGKTTSARILARCLNCEQGPTPTPCGECPSCVELARGGPGSLDVVEIDAASHGGVDDARDLRERAAFAPVRDRFKVFIIDEAHMVSTQGFNALLKIVEEPPEHIRFIFATTEPEKVIGTIRSRTHHYPFRLVPPERLQEYLAEVCGREGVPIGKGVLPLVVRAGGGSVRDSLSVLDQLIAGADATGLQYATAVALLGYTDGALLDDVIDALAAGDGATVFTVVDRVVQSGHDPRRFVEDLLERLRDLLILEAVRDGAHAVLRGVPDDQLDRMRGQAARFGAAELSRAADVANTALTEMIGATSPRLHLELLCARLLLPGAEDEERGLRARVDRIEKRMGVAAPGAVPGGGAPVAAEQPTPPPTPARRPRVVAEPGPAPPDPAAPEAPPEEVRPEPARPAPSAPAAQAPAAAPAAAAPVAPAAPAQPLPAPGSADAEAIRRSWPDVLAALSRVKRTTWTLVSQHAQVLDFAGGRLILGFSSPGLANSFGRGSHQEFLRQALIEVIGLDCPIEAIAGGRKPAAPPGPPPSAPAPGPPPAAQAASPPPAPPRAAPASPPPAAEPPPRPSPQAAPPGDASWPDPAPPRSAPARPAPAAPARSAPAAPATPPPAPQAAPRSRPARGPARDSGSGATPYDDVPPPPLDEPPPADDEVPPDDGRASRRPAPAGGSGPRPAAPRPAASRPAAPRPAASRPATPRSAPAPANVDLTGDEPSHDDADIEGSDLVGARVVEQLLGGRVIEERSQ
jgi:DNA polymerase-3 subunit gamma/tau